jgi:hypothetical protein
MLAESKICGARGKQPSLGNDSTDTLALLQARKQQ